MLGFLISNKDLQETNYFVNNKVQLHIPYGVAYEIAPVWNTKPQISSQAHKHSESLWCFLCIKKSKDKCLLIKTAVEGNWQLDETNSAYTSLS